MTNAETFTFRIFNMVEELNKLSIKRTALDPLTDISYKVNMQFPEKDGISVLITVIRSSGGGMESSYVINDSVSFVIKKKKITEIRFEQDNSVEHGEDIKLTDEMLDNFAERIREFCTGLLPEAESTINRSS